MTVLLEAVDRWQAIEELIKHLLVRGQIQQQHHLAILAAVKKREQSMSTGIGLGIAIPHATTEFVPDLISIIGRSEKGVDFAAPDGLPVRKIALFLVPAGQFQKHLHALADFAKMLHRENV